MHYKDGSRKSCMKACCIASSISKNLKFTLKCLTKNSRKQEISGESSSIRDTFSKQEPPAQNGIAGTYAIVPCLILTDLVEVEI